MDFHLGRKLAAVAKSRVAPVCPFLIMELFSLFFCLSACKIQAEDFHLCLDSYIGAQLESCPAFGGRKKKLSFY